MTLPELSEEAQNAVVDALIGVPVPPLSDAVKAEIKAWAETDERMGFRVDGVSV